MAEDKVEMRRRDSLLRAASSLMELDIPQLQEDVFVSRFLPWFADPPADMDLGPWLDVARNPQMPVHIVKDNQILFTVPPLLRDVPFAEAKGPQDSIFEIMALFKKKLDLSPVFGENYLNNELSAKLPGVKPTLDVLHTWNEIFTRYGYPTIPLPNVTDGSKSAPQLSTSKPDIGYEDF